MTDTTIALPADTLLALLLLLVLSSWALGPVLDIDSAPESSIRMLHALAVRS